MMNAKALFDKIVFGSFLVLVASLAIQKPAVTDLFNIPVSATDVLFPIVLILSVLAMILNRKLPKWNTIYICFAGYIAAFVFASLFSPDIRTSFAKTFATAYLVGLSVIALNLIDSQKRLRFTIFAWLAGAAIPVLIGIGTIFLFYLSPASPLLPFVTYHYGAVPVGNFPRLSSTFVSASMFCNYLTATIMILLSARTFERIPQAVWWVFFVLVVVCSVFTVSAGLGAFILGITVWYCFATGNSRRGMVLKYSGIVFCALSLFAILVAFQPHTTAPYSVHLPVTGIELFPSSRLMVWTHALDTFLRNFITGNGPGMPSAAVTFQNTDGHSSLLTDAHNSYLSVAAQTGVFGLLALIAISAYCIKTGFDRPPISPVRFALTVAFLCGFVVQGLTGSFEDARHQWVVIGMLIASVEIDGFEAAGSPTEV